MSGMLEIGPWTLIEPVTQSADIELRMLARNAMSQKLSEDIDKSVKATVDKAYEIAKEHIL